MQAFKLFWRLALLEKKYILFIDFMNKRYLYHKISYGEIKKLKGGMISA